MSSRKTLVLEGPITKIEFEGTSFTARIDTVDGVASDAYATTRDYRTGTPLPHVYGGSLVDARGKKIPAVVGDRARFTLTRDESRFLSIAVNGRRAR
jgi:hypothetical protein